MKTTHTPSQPIAKVLMLALLVIMLSYIGVSGFVVLNQSETLSKQTQPITFADIRVNFNPHRNYGKDGLAFSIQSFPEIHTLSTQDISILSDTAPTSIFDPQFTPFGENIRVEFTIPNSIRKNGSNYDQNIQNDEYIEEDYNFILSIPDAVISLNPDDPSANVTMDEAGNPRYEYSKRVSYRGEQKNDDGTTDILVVSIIPNSGDFDHLYSSENGSKLESQSQNDDINVKPMKPESISPLSGRHENGYTIDGVLLMADGRIVEITSFSTLLFRQREIQASLEEHIDNLDKQIENSTQNNEDVSPLSIQKIETQNRLEELSTFISVLYEQQRNSAYDLSFTIVGQESPECLFDEIPDANSQVVQPDLNSALDEALSEGNTSPLAMASQWALNRWASSCHSRMGKQATVFPVRLYLTWTFQQWISNAIKTSNNVNSAIVNGRLQAIMSVFNLAFNQQLDVSVELYQTRSFGATELNDSVNLLSTWCDIAANLQPFTTWASNTNNLPTSERKAIVHLLRYCSSLSPTAANQGGVAGYASTPALCTTNGGVSAFWPMGRSIHWMTFQHEVGHQFGAGHAWNQPGGTGQGTTGGIMDYATGRLSKPGNSDHNRYGYFETTDSTKMCLAISNALSNTSGCWHNGISGGLSSQKMTNSDGIVQSFEQCDTTGLTVTSGNTVCCKNGRFTTQDATCGFQNECCNSDCKDPGIQTCKLEGETGTGSGYCSAGKCVDVCTETFPTLTCSSGNPSPKISISGCNVYCSSVCSDGTSAGSRAPPTNPGTRCSAVNGVATGECIPGGDPFNDYGNAMQCTTTASDAFTWSVSTFTTCSVLTNTLDAYVCLSPGGIQVGDNYCASVTKPCGSDSCFKNGAITSVTVPSGTKIPGQTVDITWVYSGSNYWNQVNVYLGGSTVLIGSNLDNYSGAATVTIPDNTPYTSSTFIRVCRTGGTTACGSATVVCGDSNAFAIPDPGASTYIATPSVSEITLTNRGIDSGATFTVKWAFVGSNTATVSISLLSSTDSQLAILTSSVSANSSPQTFTMPTTIAAQDGVKVRITLNGDSSVRGDTSGFTVYKYSWVAGTSVPPTCPSPICSAVSRTTPYTCQRAPSNTPSPGKCTDPDPTSTTPCAITSCTNGGVCVTAQQKCNCRAGWSGYSCDVPTVISNPQLSTPDSTASPLSIDIGSQPLTITWDVSGGEMTLDVLYRPSGSGNPVILASNVPTQDKTYTITSLPAMISSSNSAVIALRLTGVTSMINSPLFYAVTYSWNSGEWNSCSTSVCAKGVQTRVNTCVSSAPTTPVASSSKCTATAPDSTQECTPATTCGNNGKCTDSKDECVCNEGFNGAVCTGRTTCSVDPADNTRNKCANGGSITYDENKQVCLDNCNCPNSWTDASETPSPVTYEQPGCTICPLHCSDPTVSPDGLTVTGKHDADCRKCVCNDGYYGEQCACLQFFVTFVLVKFPQDAFKSPSMTVASDPNRRVEDDTGYQQQIDALGVIDNLMGTKVYQPLGLENTKVVHWRVETIEGQRYLYVTVAVRTPCQSLFNVNTVFKTLSTVQQYDQVQQLMTQINDNQSVLRDDMTIQTPLSIADDVYDPSCNPDDFSGNANFQCGKATTPFIEPATIENPDTKKDNKTTIIIVVVVVVVGGVLLLLLIILLICCCCTNGGKKSSEPRQNKDLELHPPPYTANPMITSAPTAPTAPIAPRAPK